MQQADETKVKGAEEMKGRLQFEFNGKWLSLPKAAEVIGVAQTTLRWWVKAGILKEKTFEYLGYMPETRWYHSAMDAKATKGLHLGDYRKSKPRWFMVYVTNDPEIHGIDVGYGSDEGEAIANFLKSRQKSDLEFEVKYISKNEIDCQWVIGRMMNGRMCG